MMGRLGMTILVVAMLIVGGCAANKFTRQRYDTIYVGQDKQSVREKLGEPTIELPEGWLYRNEMPYYEARILFSGDRVSEKAWIEERKDSRTAEGVILH